MVSDQSRRLHRRKRYDGGYQLLMPPLHPSDSSLVKSLISLSHPIIQAQSLKLSSQRHNVSAIARRVEILLIFLDEVHDTACTLPPSAHLCFLELHVVLQAIKLLLEDCTDSSRMGLLLEHRRISERFHRLSQEMATVLQILPLDLLDVSCDVREQLELMMKQAMRSKAYVDPKEARLCGEVQFAMAQIERKKATPEAVALAEIFDSLDLKSAKDCQKELERLRNEEREGVWDFTDSLSKSAENRKVPLNDLVSFVRYCKCVLYGATEVSNDDDLLIDAQVVNAEDGSEEPDITVPHDFCCPISLELMTDPVIIASGQTYDRAAITQWIVGGKNRTCPKSGLPLTHTTLTPNYALRSLIQQWCLQHNIRFHKPRAASRHHSGNCTSLSTPAALEATKLTVELLLQQLSSASADNQRHIAGELRMLAKCGSDNHKLIADLGAIPLLIPLLSAADARTKEHAVSAILNLSIYGPNKAQIFNIEGALDSAFKLMQCHTGDVTEATRENAAALLFSLSQMTEVVAEIGQDAKAIEGLLHIVKEGRTQGKHDAVSALFNMALYRPNRSALLKAGVVGVVIEVLSSADKGGIEDEGLALLAVLASTMEGQWELTASTSVLPLLVGELRTGSDKGKENAAAILLRLCRYGSHGVRRKLYGALPYLQSLHMNGTPRGRRKAASLLQILFR